MTEVRASESGHLGFFAVKDFSVGDVLLEEFPFVTLAPLDDQSSARLLEEWMGETVKCGSGSKKESGKAAGELQTLWSWIKPPPSDLVPKHHHGTFKGMVQAGIVFIKNYNNEETKNRLDSLLKLYYPKNDSKSVSEKDILAVAEEAILFLKQHVTTNKATGKEFSSFNDWENLQNVILAWACNAFEGGRIYHQISRVNHSCNPNAIIKTSDTNKEGQKVVAATKIERGTEVCISYLGMLLYTDTIVRRKKLERTKFFRCTCPRCTDAMSTSSEGAAQIPCPTCHPREPQQMSLEEDIQYDDDQTVKYTSLLDPEHTKACWKDCEPGKSLGDEKLFTVLRNLCGKMEVFLDTFDESRMQTKSADDDDEEKEVLLEEHVSLASTMMGDKHWSSNLGLLLHLDRRLKAMSQRMIVTQELPDLEEVAEAIDSLQRLYRFVDSLGLDLHPGHLLGDVTIGTARLLISLGDEKSQKYGADWLTKIDEYVTHFSNEGVRKVADVLKVAWKKHHRADEDIEDSSAKKSKKAKLS